MQMSSAENLFKSDNISKKINIKLYLAVDFALAVEGFITNHINETLKCLGHIRGISGA